MHQYPKFFPCDCSASTQIRFMFQVNACIECELFLTFGRLPLIVSFACARYLGEASETEYTHGRVGCGQPEPACGRQGDMRRQLSVIDDLEISRILKITESDSEYSDAVGPPARSSSSFSIFGVVIFPPTFRYRLFKEYLRSKIKCRFKVLRMKYIAMLHLGNVHISTHGMEKECEHPAARLLSRNAAKVTQCLTLASLMPHSLNSLLLSRQNDVSVFIFSIEKTLSWPSQGAGKVKVPQEHSPVLAMNWYQCAYDPVFIHQSWQVW